jgi:hypothetical protein
MLDRDTVQLFVDETGFNEPVIRLLGYRVNGQRLLGERTE